MEASPSNDLDLDLDLGLEVEPSSLLRPSPPSSPKRKEKVSKSDKAEKDPICARCGGNYSPNKPSPCMIHPGEAHMMYDKRYPGGGFSVHMKYRCCGREYNEGSRGEPGKLKHFKTFAEGCVDSGKPHVDTL